MEIKGIKYISPCFDHSGYGRASRENIKALHSKGVPITLSPISFEKVKADLGKDGDLLRTMVDKDIEYNVVFIQLTPEFYSKYRENNKVNIGYTVWENSRLHNTWPGFINESLDKVAEKYDIVASLVHKWRTPQQA